MIPNEYRAFAIQSVYEMFGQNEFIRKNINYFLNNATRVDGLKCKNRLGCNKEHLYMGRLSPPVSYRIARDYNAYCGNNEKDINTYYICLYCGWICPVAYYDNIN